MRLARLVKKKLTRSMSAHYLRKGKNVGQMLKNPTETIKMFGEITKHQVKSNPFIRVLVNRKNTDPKKYAEAFRRMSEAELPSQATLRTLSKTLKINDVEQMVNLAINNPEYIQKHIAGLSNNEKEDLRVSIESDTNEASLSSSWLAYGTYVSDKKNPNRGVLYLTTKDDVKFKTPPTTLGVWEQMKRKRGVSSFNKDGTRKGASFGAGTILHQFIPQSTWRKVNNPEEQAHAPDSEKASTKIKRSVKGKVSEKTKKTLNKTGAMKTINNSKKKVNKVKSEYVKVKKDLNKIKKKKKKKKGKK